MINAQINFIYDANGIFNVTVRNNVMIRNMKLKYVNCNYNIYVHSFTAPFQLNSPDNRIR